MEVYKFIFGSLMVAVMTFPAVSFAIGADVKVDPKEIDELLNGWHPKTGTIVENDDYWCVSNDWELRDKFLMRKGGSEVDKFSRKTGFGFLGAKWFCYFK